MKSSFSALVTKLMERTERRGKSSPRATKPLNIHEGTLVTHPTNGVGKIVHLRENDIGVRFERLDLRVLGPVRFTFAEANNYLRLLPESYTEKKEKADVKSGKKKMFKKDDKKKVAKKKVDEAQITMGRIPGTYIGGRPIDNKPYLINLTAEDLGLIVREEESEENETEGTEEATDWSQDTIAFQPTRNTPLSVEGGEESAEDTGPHVKDDMVMPDDAPSVPKAKQMAQSQSGNARAANNSQSDGSNPFAKKSDNSDRSESEGSDDNEPKEEKKSMSETKKRMAAKPFATKPSYKKLIERITFNDLAECDDMGQGHMGRMPEGQGMMLDGVGYANPGANVNEHNMDAGEIAVTQDLMVSLFKAVVDAGLDESKMKLVAQAMAECCQDDRTLTIDDAGQIQSKLKELMGQSAPAGDSEGSEGDEGGQFEDKAKGDGEPAGAEGGPEHEGETKLMRNDSGEGDETDRGEEFHIHFGHDEQGAEDNHEDHAGKEHRDDSGDESSEESHEERREEPKREESKREETSESRRAKGKGAPKKGKKKLNEFWIAPIGGTYRGNERPEIDTTLSEDDAEIALIKYRAGITSK